MADAAKAWHGGRHDPVHEWCHLFVWAMNLLHTPFAAFAACLTVAVVTILAKGSLWHLGTTYWFLLGLLALIHVIVSVAAFVTNPGRLPIKLGVVLLLIVGQWWAVQMIVMQIIWRLRGFAP